jgi:hypothetical protein
VSRAYITLWSQPEVEIEHRGGPTENLRHTANAQFGRVGVEPGDRVYIVATRKGQLLLLARLTVERLVGQAEAERILGRDDVYQAPDHLIGAGTALSLDRVVPEEVARAIERESGKRLGVDPDRYVVSVHSLRATGRITDDSAALLDALL